jgi:hypothetical protein
LRVGERITLEVALHQTVPGAEGGYADVGLQRPMKKPVYWMLSIRTMTTPRDTLAMKCVTVAKMLTVRLDFTLPDEGEYQLELYGDCDSYMGLSQSIWLRDIVVRS